MIDTVIEKRQDWEAAIRRDRYRMEDVSIHSHFDHRTRYRIPLSFALPFDIALFPHLFLIFTVLEQVVKAATRFTLTCLEQTNSAHARAFLLFVFFPIKSRYKLILHHECFVVDVKRRDPFAATSLSLSTIIRLEHSNITRFSHPCITKFHRLKIPGLYHTESP